MASLETLRGALLPDALMGALFDGVWIVAFCKNTPYNISLVRPDLWDSVKSDYGDPYAVAYRAGGRLMGLALTEAKLQFGAYNWANYTRERWDSAQSLFNGKERTAQWVAEQPSTEYAPAYCAAYSAGTKTAFAAGKWWLPSLGELLPVAENAAKINYALNIIGATPLSGNNFPTLNTYWTSNLYVSNGIGAAAYLTSINMYFMRIDGSSNMGYQYARAVCEIVPPRPDSL